MYIITLLQEEIKHYLMLSHEFLSFSTLFDYIGVWMGAYLGAIYSNYNGNHINYRRFSLVSFIAGIYGAEYGANIINELTPGMLNPHAALGAILISYITERTLKKLSKNAFKK